MSSSSIMSSMSSRLYMLMPPMPMSFMFFIMRCMSRSFLSTGSNAGPLGRDLGSGGAFLTHAPKPSSSSLWHMCCTSAARCGDPVKRISATSVSRSATIFSHARCMVLHSLPHAPYWSFMSTIFSSDPFSWRSCVMSHSPSTASGSQTFSTFSSTSLSLSFAPFVSRSVDASRLSTLATSWHTWHRMYFTSDLTARSSSGSFFFFFFPAASAPVGRPTRRMTEMRRNVKSDRMDRGFIVPVRSGARSAWKTLEAHQSAADRIERA